ncbi:COG4-domain-containing protein [Irpex rosettiformis]|uniref:COG4-domain-containing protein n=1 Tax=Irpex rosettiformis TaxID=378272 RepID=A0ACB8TXE3_9APHY|nr:COG4-domain-containing protein [Irpex rosettiformis]
MAIEILESITRPDLRSLTTLPDILASLASLEQEETGVSTSLSELLANTQPIVDTLTRLQGLSPRLNELYDEATALSGTVSTTAKTADRVGGRVRLLDEEMKRVREAGDRVGQVMELKSSLAALQSSMESQDWESATRHCARAMATPLDVTSGHFAETAVPTSESPLPPAQTLQTSREALLQIFRDQFEKASTSRDAAATSRFFKLFPAIGWEEEGLQAYAAFVVDLVKVRAPASAKMSSPLYFITSLTALFESIAMIVDQHQPVVEKYYGAGKMASVLERLLQESDRVSKGLIDNWIEERSMKRKLSDIANSAFQTLSSPSASQIRRATSTMNVAEEDTVDAREIDKVITEVAGMGGRWGMFRKFLYERLEEDEDDEDDSEGRPTEEPQAPQTAKSINTTFASEQDAPGSEAAAVEEIQAVETCATRRIMLNTLETYYVPLEVWYTRSSIDKAHTLSKPDLTQFPIITTTPDDAFYILKIVMNRLLSSGNPRIVEKTSELLREVMDRDYAGVLKKKLDDVYRTGGPGSTGRGEKESRQSFIILLNDLDISSSHMERLIKDLLTSDLISQNFLDSEIEGVKTSVLSLTNLVPRFRSTLRAGIEQLFNQLLRPKLRMFIPDVYKDVSYVLDDDSYAAAEYNDIVRKRFIKAWEGLVEGYKDTFTESNYRLFFGLTIDVLVRPWEKFVAALKYTELGAIRFDRDLRAVTTYLSSQTAFGDIREKFLRLQQISTLLNLDSEEDVDDFYNSSGITWKLNEQEARMVGGLRV